MVWGTWKIVFTGCLGKLEVRLGVEPPIKCNRRRGGGRCFQVWIKWDTGKFSIWVVGSFSLGHWSFPSDHWDLDFHWVTGLFSLGHLVVLTGSLDCFRFGFWSRAHGISVFNLTSVFKCCVRCNCVCLMVQRWACRLGEVHYIFGGFYPDIQSGAGRMTNLDFKFLKISVL